MVPEMALESSLINAHVTSVGKKAEELKVRLKTVVHCLNSSITVEQLRKYMFDKMRRQQVHTNNCSVAFVALDC